MGSPIVINIEKKQKNKSFTRIFGKETDISDGLPDVYTKGKLTNQRAHKLNRWKSQAKRLFFHNCTFTACDFRSAFFDACVFQNCTFESSTMSDANFNECTFTNCTFSANSLIGTNVYESTFKDCSFRYSHFDQAKFSLVTFKQCEFSAVAATGATFYKSRLDLCRFNIADFREATLYNTFVTGTIFINSDFSKTLFSCGETVNTEFDDCCTIECRSINIRTDSAALLRAKHRTIAQKLTLREAQKKQSRKTESMGRYEMGIIYKAIKRWFAMKDIDRNYSLFAENNSRRLDWAADKLDQKGRTFLRLLPALLHTDLFERKTGFEHLCIPSRIRKYSICPRTADALSRLFPNMEINPEPDIFVPIEALLSIGSTGTIAQTKASDIDCWVCCDFSKCPPDSRARLQFKLEAIEEWAENDFGLEVHFFVMDVKDIRENKFGLSDEESSGSAQSALLKEEFYRTALLLAGKPPLWWFTPAESDNRVYENTGKIVSVLKGTDFYIDLGNVPHIPMEEFLEHPYGKSLRESKAPLNP